ncbi:hypothetical protein TUBRATIS_005420 [Tubulinosema ratisbonensis]|uniref:Uncharacterized protein n=1 Tax=Tubulinosema ratisbonensis TaxID=291195 RepID=A0A437ANZ0_9MICR|nr:hypothetical protein TUBRATIS_005420 [Tubulinosema ratisbonensis]
MTKNFNITRVINGTKYLCKEIIVENTKMFLQKRVNNTFLRKYLGHRTSTTTQPSVIVTKKLGCIVDSSYTFFSENFFEFLYKDYPIGLKIFLILLIVFSILILIFTFFRFLSFIKEKFCFFIKRRRNLDIQQNNFENV